MTAFLSRRDIYDIVLVWQGDWNPVGHYIPGDVIVSGGQTYICTVQNSNRQPPNDAYWQST